MQLGYLTREGQLVTVDTLGSRLINRAFRILEEKQRFIFLTASRPMQLVGDVFVTVHLHREGWGKRGEVRLSRAKARLYHTKNQNVLIGSSWRNIKGLKWNVAWQTYAYWKSRDTVEALLNPFPIKTYSFLPWPNSRFVSIFHDQSIKGCRRTGSRVVLYAVETKEFTEMVIGKLTATLDFASEQEAEAFARNYPKIEDPNRLDPGVEVVVNRARKFVGSRKQFLLLGLLVGVVLGVAAVVFYAVTVLQGNVRLLRALSALAIVVVPVAVSFRRSLYLEQQDLVLKWPRHILEKWASESKEHAASFPILAKELFIELDSTGNSLESVDNFLRRLPKESYFGPFAWSAAALLGEVLMAKVAGGSNGQWHYDPAIKQNTLSFDSVGVHINPINRVRTIWVDKDPLTLDEFVENWSSKVRFRSAFPTRELVALGFVNKTWDDFDVFAEKFQREIEAVTPEAKRLGEEHYVARTLHTGPFEVLFVETEVPVLGRVPMMGVPFCNSTQTLGCRLEASTPQSPVREDVAIVRFQANELIPLAIQVYNYLDVGPGFAKRMDDFEMNVLAVAANAEVLGPRVREQLNQNDRISPQNFQEGSAPLVPYADFLGKVISVSELVNPFSQAELWKVGLEISGFRLELIVRKDRCAGVPEPGFHLSGSVWIVGRIPPSGEVPAGYIG